MRSFARDVEDGSIVERPGEHGAGAIDLDVDAARYYRDPVAAATELYGVWLAGVDG